MPRHHRPRTRGRDAQPGSHSSSSSYSASDNKSTSAEAEAETATESLETEIDFYAALGIPRDADAAAIRASYRRLALRFHPDKQHAMSLNVRLHTDNDNDSAATLNNANDVAEKFRQISEAHAVLSDPRRRKMYDLHGMRGLEVFDSLANDMRAAQQATTDRLNKERVAAERRQQSRQQSPTSPGDAGEDEQSRQWFWQKREPVYDSLAEIEVVFCGMLREKWLSLLFWKPYFRNCGVRFHSLYVVSLLVDRYVGGWLVGGPAPFSWAMTVLYLAFVNMWASRQTKADKNLILGMLFASVIVSLLWWWWLPTFLMTGGILAMSYLTLPSVELTTSIAYLWPGVFPQILLFLVLDFCFRGGMNAAARGYWTSLFLSLAFTFSAVQFALIGLAVLKPSLDAGGVSLAWLGRFVSMFLRVCVTLPCVLLFESAAFLLKFLRRQPYVASLETYLPPRRDWIIAGIKIAAWMLIWGLDHLFGAYIERIPFLFVALAVRFRPGLILCAVSYVVSSYILPRWVIQYASSASMMIFTMLVFAPIPEGAKPWSVFGNQESISWMQFSTSVALLYFDTQMRGLGLFDWMPLPDDRPEQDQGYLMWEWLGLVSISVQIMAAVIVFSETLRATLTQSGGTSGSATTATRRSATTSFDAGSEGDDDEDLPPLIPDDQIHGEDLTPLIFENT